jgi:hypothetical protein
MNGEGQQEPDDFQLETSGAHRVDPPGKQRTHKVLKTVSMYWRVVGLLKNSSHAAIGRLDLFLRWALRCKPTSFSKSS